MTPLKVKVPYYLDELTEKNSLEDRIQILKASLAKLKVDESVNKVQSSAPTNLKQVSTQATNTAQKAPQAVCSVLADVKNTGMVDTASGFSVYTMCEPTAKYMYT